MSWSALVQSRTTPAHRHKLARFCFVTAALLLPGGYATARYGLGIDLQAVRCLPDVRAVLIDRWQPPTARGDLVVFEAQGLAPAFATGTLLVKRLEALPGDLVDVTAEGVRVNGQLVVEGLGLATKLPPSPATTACPPASSWRWAPTLPAWMAAITARCHKAASAGGHGCCSSHAPKVRPHHAAGSAAHGHERFSPGPARSIDGG